MDVGLAGPAGLQAFRGEAPCFVPADGAVSGACHVAVAGVDLEGRAAGADAKFDDPLRRLGPVAAAVFFLRLPLQDGGDLGIDALHPQGVPDAQCAQALQVRRQIIEHFFDSMPMIDFLFDTVRVEMVGGDTGNGEQRAGGDGDACALPGPAAEELYRQVAGVMTRAVGGHPWAGRTFTAGWSA